MGVDKNILGFEFSTERLEITNTESIYKFSLENSIIEILSPEVTKALPEGWQNIDNKQKAENWLKDRKAESTVLFINHIAYNTLIGFVFLYESNTDYLEYNLRFGYLLSKEYWSKGLGTELITALVKKCNSLGNINSISGGVEKDNIGSIKVLERTGFIIMEEEGAPPDIIFYEYKF